MIIAPPNGSGTIIQSTWARESVLHLYNYGLFGLTVLVWQKWNIIHRIMFSFTYKHLTARIIMFLLHFTSTDTINTSKPATMNKLIELLAFMFFAHFVANVA